MKQNHDSRNTLANWGIEFLESLGMNVLSQITQRHRIKDEAGARNIISAALGGLNDELKKSSKFGTIKRKEIVLFAGELLGFVAKQLVQKQPLSSEELRLKIEEIFSQHFNHNLLPYCADFLSTLSRKVRDKQLATVLSGISSLYLQTEDPQRWAIYG